MMEVEMSIFHSFTFSKITNYPKFHNLPNLRILDQPYPKPTKHTLEHPRNSLINEYPHLQHPISSKTPTSPTQAQTLKTFPGGEYPLKTSKFPQSQSNPDFPLFPEFSQY